MRHQCRRRFIQNAEAARRGTGSGLLNLSRNPGLIVGTSALGAGAEAKSSDQWVHGCTRIAHHGHFQAQG
ncbi:hypothetical protein EXW72_24285 [Pseudomonas sp. BCA14]|nr:hypothetical protein EXW71_21200 [Pseudomonas sp. BCA17]TFF09218.1 hypothetical protein EXW70_09215 [Pseudomonas sp. JMN1]TFF19332.1 hypothetical protein EXW72_24285 [Pseudomonas sp. BCA14]TFF21440.1 hypothetical protein EXW73_21065 [Pseudomonas sp. BCA13]